MGRGGLLRGSSALRGRVMMFPSLMVVEGGVSRVGGKK